jgi:hypothetical protein
MLQHYRISPYSSFTVHICNIRTKCLISIPHWSQKGSHQFIEKYISAKNYMPHFPNVIILTLHTQSYYNSHCIICSIKLKAVWFLNTHLSIHIFSTCGTSTCKSRIIVCSGSFVFQELTHSEVGTHWPPAPIPIGGPMPLSWARECASVSRILWRYGSNKGLQCDAEQNITLGKLKKIKE